MKKILFCIVFLAVLVGITPMAHALGWVSPTGHLDEEGSQWTSLVNAYDSPVQPNLNYATSNPRLGWAGWADFTLPAPIYCGRVRVNCDFGYAHVDQVQVDVWNTDTLAWENVHTGVVSDGSYSELTFASRNLSKMRFRFHYIDAGWQFWLYEVGFYESPPAITAPEVVTLDATSVDVDSANPHGLFSNDGGEPCSAWLEYGPTAAYGSITSVQSGYLTGQSFGAFLSGLSGTYHFRAVASNSAGTSYGNDLTFTANSVSVAGWVSPTNSYTDPSPPTPNTGGWSSQTAAYDDEGLTGSTLTHSINDASPSPYLYLTHPALRIDKIRYQAKKTTEITGIDIWVLRDGAWTNVYPTGTFNDSAGGSVWNEVSFTAGSVTAARVRFSIPTNYGLNMILYDFDFHTVGVEHCHAFVDGAFAGANK